MRRKVGLILGIVLFIEVIAAVVIVQAAGGFGNLFSFGLGPERTQEIPAQLYDFKGQPADISINNGSGRIEITANPGLSGAQVAATKVIHSTDDKDFDQLKLIVTQDGSKLQITSNLAQGVNFGFSPSIIVRLEVPPAQLAHLSTQNGSGDVVMTGIQNEQASVELNSGSGDVTVNQSVLKALSLKTGSGDLRLDSYTGDLNAQTGSGSIRLDGKNSLNAVQARTGSGDIRFNNATLRGEGQINTGSGDVTLNLGGSAAPGFDASADSGNVKVKLDGVQINSSDKHHARTQGSPLITIHTGSGNINIGN